jgi:hypothetical protein
VIERLTGAAPAQPTTAPPAAASPALAGASAPAEGAPAAETAPDAPQKPR